MDPKRLREATRREHEATEALLPLSHAGLTAGEYQAGLMALWPVVSSWESWAEQHAPEDLRALVQERRRAALLAEDLARIGADRAEARELVGVDWAAVVRGGPEEAGEGFGAQFLGALYVMEGSTLGGRFLARHVVAELGEAYGPATRYFQGHGEQTGSMWREVTARLGEIPDSEAEATIRAAQRTFGAFGRGLQAGLTPFRHPGDPT